MTLGLLTLTVMFFTQTSVTFYNRRLLSMARERLRRKKSIEIKEEDTSSKGDFVKPKLPRIKLRTGMFTNKNKVKSRMRGSIL